MNAVRDFSLIHFHGEATARSQVHGFKLHLACNDRGEIIAFVLTGANVSDKDTKVFKVLAFRLQAKANFLRFLSVACKRNTVFRVFCISLANDVFSLFSVLHCWRKIGRDYSSPKSLNGCAMHPV